MKTMQSELKILNSDLYDSFQISLKKAQTEWLPSVEPSKSSYNSWPHILGVMEQIDNLLYNEELGNADIVLNDIELYVMLNAVLFHDMGKTIKEDGINHAEQSRKTILSNWAVLGIKTERIAEVIAAIVLFHDPDYRVVFSKKENEEGEYLFKKILTDEHKEILDRLSYKTTVYSHGFVRSKFLAVLLFLADHLDNSYSRVRPGYLKGKMEVVGEFRKNIISTYYNKYTQMVCVEVKECIEIREIETNKKIYKDKHEEMVGFINIAEYYNKTIYQNYLEDKKNKNTDDISNYKISDEHPNGSNKLSPMDFIKCLSNEQRSYWNYILKDKLSEADSIKRDKVCKIKKSLENATKKNTEDAIKELIADAIENIIADEIKKIEEEAIKESIADAIMKSVILNDNDMEAIKHDLSLMGLPIKGWYIERNGLLYSPYFHNSKFECRYAYEPILDFNYCKEIIYAIIKIGTGIIGKKYHPYESIANFIHEDMRDIEKVKCAVKRIAALIETSQEDFSLSIECDTKWWSMTIDEKDKKEEKKEQEKAKDKEKDKDKEKESRQLPNILQQLKKEIIKQISEIKE
ncbi:MAG: hypothetical protein AB1Z23_01080 [Eubacteriales bacterium]